MPFASNAGSLYPQLPPLPPKPENKPEDKPPAKQHILECTVAEESKQLNGDQLRFVDKVIENHLAQSGQVTMLIGEAGTGKSTAIEGLEQRIAITKSAMTGKAAILIGGMTVDSLFCLNRPNDGYGQPTVWSTSMLNWNMKSCSDIIMIDEAGMLGYHMFEVIHDICQSYGKTLVLVCDYVQLGPVKDAWAVNHHAIRSADVIKLTKVYRQKDAEMLKGFYHLRRGQAADAYPYFAECQCVSPQELDDTWMRLYATNKSSNDFNYHRICGFNQTAPATCKVRDIRHEERGKDKMTVQQMERLCEDSPLAHGQFAIFAAGCRVVITCNDIPPTTDDEGNTLSPRERSKMRRYMNGDTGTIETMNVQKIKDHKGAEGNAVVGARIRLDRTGESIYVSPHIAETKDASDRTVALIWGMPIALGYAITIHKAQGMTLQKVYVDLSTIRYFPQGSRHGLGYTALSRATSKEGLKWSGWSDDVFEVDQQVHDYI